MGRLVKYTGNAAKLLAPWVARIVWICLKLMLLSLVSFWIGVPETMRRMSNEWSRGQPEHPVFAIFYMCLAVTEILVGWIILAHITVFVVRMIF